MCSIALVGVIFLYVMSQICRSRQLRRRGMPAAAEVVGIDTYYGQANVSRHPVVRFATADNETITMRCDRMRGISVGDRVEIRYLPERPKVTAPPDGGFPYSSTIWPLLSSAFFLAIGIRLLT